jgi:transposase
MKPRSLKPSWNKEASNGQGEGVLVCDQNGCWAIKATAAARFVTTSNDEELATRFRVVAMRTRTGPFNRTLYKERNRVERLINRLKQFRRVATRYEKRAVNFLAMVTIASILLWL